MSTHFVMGTGEVVVVLSMPWPQGFVYLYKTSRFKHKSKTSIVGIALQNVSVLHFKASIEQIVIIVWATHQSVDCKSVRSSLSFTPFEELLSNWGLISMSDTDVSVSCSFLSITTSS